MFKKTLAAAAIAFVLPVSGFASTANIVGGQTDITVDEGALAAFTSLGLTLGDDGTGALSGATLSYAITGGQAHGADLVIEHDGSVATISAGGTSAAVGNFVIKTSESAVFGQVGLGGLGDLAGESIALFNFDSRDTDASDGIDLVLSLGLATTLASVFHVDEETAAALSDNFLFGTAVTSPELAPVPLPAGLPLLLAGLGGLGLLKRHRRRS